jgi:hypothetical protein
MFIFSCGVENRDKDPLEIELSAGYHIQNISGDNNRCWLRCAWYVVFDALKNNPQLISEAKEKLKKIGSVSENNLLVHLDDILSDKNYLLDSGGRYQGKLEEIIVEFTRAYILSLPNHIANLKQNNGGSTAMINLVVGYFSPASKVYCLDMTKSRQKIKEHNLRRINDEGWCPGGIREYKDDEKTLMSLNNPVIIEVLDGHYQLRLPLS